MTAAPISPSREPERPIGEALRGIVPKLVEIANTVIFGEIWKRPALSKRDRSLITVAVLVTMGREKHIHDHLTRALQNGVTKEEIGELLTHLAFYAGWPSAMTGAAVAKDVFEKN